MILGHSGSNQSVTERTRMMNVDDIVLHIPDGTGGYDDCVFIERKIYSFNDEEDDSLGDSLDAVHVFTFENLKTGKLIHTKTYPKSQYQILDEQRTKDGYGYENPPFSDWRN